MDHTSSLKCIIIITKKYEWPSTGLEYIFPLTHLKCGKIHAHSKWNIIPTKQPHIHQIIVYKGYLACWQHSLNTRGID